MISRGNSPSDVLRFLDSKKVPRPNISTDFVAPRSPTESKMIAIWCDVLDLQAVGIDDEIFDLGGDSLDIIRILSRIWSEFGTEIEVADFFDYPTVRDLARIIGESELYK